MMGRREITPVHHVISHEVPIIKTKIHLLNGFLWKGQFAIDLFGGHSDRQVSLGILITNVSQEIDESITLVWSLGKFMVLGGNFARFIESATTDGVLPIDIDPVADSQSTRWIQDTSPDLQVVIPPELNDFCSKRRHITRTRGHGKVGI
jgi:hypothetical protein